MVGLFTLLLLVLDTAVSLSKQIGLLLPLEAAEKLIINLVLVAALLLASTVSIVTSVSNEEMIAGNIVAMAQGSVAFRCKFFPNATYHPCRGRFDLKSCDKPKMCVAYSARDIGMGLCGKEKDSFVYLLFHEISTLTSTIHTI